jgi:type IV pilus assembly protein PilW
MRFMMDHFQKTAANGFTLIELLIAMTLALIILMSISGAFISQHKTYKVEEQITEMTQGARAAMDIISSEIKMAGYKWDPAGASTLQTTDSSAATYVGMLYNTSQLEIRADLGQDGTIGGATTNEKIIYTYDSGNKQIGRNTGDGAKTLAENIEGFTFKYYKHDSATGSVVEVVNATDEELISMIEISITARTAEPDPVLGYREYTLASFITPPNLKN